MRSPRSTRSCSSPRRSGGCSRPPPGPVLESELRGLLAGEDDYRAAGKPACDWDDPQARAELSDRLARDGMVLLAALEGRLLDASVAQAAELLATVIGQDLAADDDVSDRAGSGDDRVISTVDPDARHHSTASTRAGPCSPGPSTLPGCPPSGCTTTRKLTHRRPEPSGATYPPHAPSHRSGPPVAVRRIEPQHRATPDRNPLLPGAQPETTRVIPRAQLAITARGRQARRRPAHEKCDGVVRQQPLTRFRNGAAGDVAVGATPTRPHEHARDVQHRPPAHHKQSGGAHGPVTPPHLRLRAPPNAWLRASPSPHRRHQPSLRTPLRSRGPSLADVRSTSLRGILCEGTPWTSSFSRYFSVSWAA